VIASGLIGSVSAVGFTLLVDSVGSVHANPYTALSLALGGIGLVLTLLVALRGK
jgi:hypothetical protein